MTDSRKQLEILIKKEETKKELYKKKIMENNARLLEI